MRVRSRWRFEMLTTRTPSRSSFEVKPDRFAGQEVRWDRIRGEGVKHDERLAAGLAGERDARVAEAHGHVGRAFGEEAEAAGVARDPQHRAVDLEEAPILPGRDVAGEAPGPEPDRRDRAESAAAGLLDRSDGGADRALVGVV